MNRKHTIEEYHEIVNKLFEARPDIKFSSDFIIGYPGEAKKDFYETLLLMHKIKFINSYSFIFSARPGTPAFNLKMIDQNDAKSRLTEFQKVAEEIKTNYRKKLIKKTVKVLFENKIKEENKYFGRDEHSNAVIVKSDENLVGKIKEILIVNINQSTLFGEINLNLDQTNYAA